MTSHGMTNTSDPRVRAAVLAKYPARSHDMPDTVLAGTCMESLSGLKQWGSITSVLLFKSAEQDPSVLHPVSVKSSFLRVLHRLVVRANTGALRDYLEPCQVALMPGGGAVLVQTVRMMLELRPDFVCVALDVRNAHNKISRRTVVEELEKVPGLRHLAQHAACCLAAHHTLESGGTAFGEAGQGLTQGDSEASGLYCVGWHRHVCRLHNRL